MLDFSVFSAYWLQRHHFDRGIQRQLASIEHLFQDSLDHEAKHISSLIDLYKIDQKLQSAYLTTDRDRLYQEALPIFQDIRTKHDITHFYFITPDKTCFLRVHNPARHGDYIDRHTLDKAVRTGTETHGIELGPFGTFTLRVVHLWRINNDLIGYLELGREIEHITPELKNILGFEFFFLVNKRYLDRDMWEEGLKMTDRSGNWDEVPGHVITSRTLPEIPAKLNRYIKLPHAGKKDLLFKVSHGNKKYRGGFAPLKDSSGQEVGEIIALQDFAQEVSEQILAGIFATVCIIIGGVLFIVFYGYIRKTEQRLSQTYKQLLHVEKLSAVGKLTASIAHEFNNPICGIRNVLEGLNRNAGLDEENGQLLDLAIKECNRVANLTSDLQAFSRPTSGKAAFVNIHKVLDELLLLSRKKFKAKKIRVEKHYAADMPEVKVVPDQLTQVFLNLLTNAEEAIQENKGVVTISTEVHDKNIVISFHDSGIGIKPEDMGRIFEPFFSTKPEVKGTGLGLSVSYGIIKRHGGKIEVESEPGKGAVFTVTLPKEGVF